jgi:hypothetical protein
MLEYRVFRLTPEGRIKQRINVVCDTEDEAKDMAKALVAGDPVELWEGLRRISRYKPQSEG